MDQKKSLLMTMLLFILLTIPVPAPGSSNETHDEFIKPMVFTGDFDEMQAQHRIRALVVYNDMFYFFDQGQPRGISYELLKTFEKSLNEKLNKGTVKIRVVCIPTTRDRIFQDLAAGYGDIASANLDHYPQTPAAGRLLIPFGR